ncbi:MULTISPECIES: class I SAM-dependent methyltransferase [Bacillus]|jgi:SAM-dependent methyltransferase|uniref:SAM methytransferase n=1 Tax=Bacillus licheniformis (strain ATCC 14580 / DSM 13 / JCM 2505 / CCUG 7422 / NBRC 12200 / NCIMB 9375 / NCTC 10341 / NRRL NRS-1264 / Gibson 46) TaxID=279010 RepID=Q65MM6_BACLD|nr:MULTISPECIES: class I SAM-dependent methyltransferase [Bacillus]AAU22338.1 putative SAM methytransferase [Bacillus licheniformis DSM 13 = ATCC 14580]AAU39688.1 putative SAM methytransferase [Bacillus licheniformis DSM 13 = ATCC 14580]ARC61874.1 methyltransferase domain protein [Bacillus licheniformis]ARC71148.1 methyltransferase domain protein [Bacillus licheniformis]AUZ29472.1 class I SAM-dependent methyltransferase [Bacillus licheniformis]
MNDKTFLSFLKHADKPFSGWDFSFIEDTGRMKSDLLSWSYGSMALSLIQDSESMLDMGTGGGEFLSKLGPFPSSAYATECYLPNVPVAKERLTPLGVQVVQIDDDEDLPFESGQFDLIINKHESYSVQEVRRILSKGGRFLTQQVGGLDCEEINEKLGVPLNEEFKDWDLETALKEMEKHDFKILKSREECPTQRFYDIGALVYYLKAIPWQALGFEVNQYKDELYEIHKMIEEKGYFDVTQYRFMILAEAV